MPVHVRTQPDAVRERPGVDAAVDLAAPVRQVVVLPAAVGGEPLGGVRQHGRVEPPLAERVQRPRRRRPRLAGTLRGLRALEVEVARGRTRRRPTGRRGPAGRAAGRRSPRSRRGRGSPPRPPRARRAGRARPASAAPGRSRAASRSARRRPSGRGYPEGQMTSPTGSIAAHPACVATRAQRLQIRRPPRPVPRRQSARRRRMDSLGGLSSQRGAQGRRRASRSRHPAPPGRPRCHWLARSDARSRTLRDAT